MSSDVAIRVENLGKRYKLGLTHKGTIREAVHGLGRRLFGRNGRKKVEGSGFSVQGSEDPASPIPQPEPRTPQPGSSLTSDLRPLAPTSGPSATSASKSAAARSSASSAAGGAGNENGTGSNHDDWCLSRFSGSALLKILSQVTKPTTGRAEIRSRGLEVLPSTLDSQPLTTFGTGFHPELTGPLEMANDQ